MIKYICLLFMFTTANAAIIPFKLDEVRIDARQYMKNGHTPYMTNGSVLNKGLDLHINNDVLRYMYINNMIWSLADQHQFRWVGWNYKIGACIMPFLDLEVDHFSRHVLERAYSVKGEKFVVEDSIGFRLYLYRASPGVSIF